MLSGLFDQLKSILPLAEKVMEDISGEGEETLEEIIPRMFEIMQTIARFSCGYVRRGTYGR